MGHTPEAIEKMRQAALKRYQDPEERRKQSEKQKGHKPAPPLSPEKLAARNEKIRQAALKRYQDPEERRLQSERLKTSYVLPTWTEELREATSEKQSEAAKKRFEDPGERELQSQRMKQYCEAHAEEIAERAERTDYTVHSVKMKQWHADATNKERHKQAVASANLSARWTTERRQAARERMLKYHEEHPEARQAAADRMNSVSNQGPWSIPTEYAGVVFHSTWEALFAQRCDELGVTWARNKESFPYVWESEQRLYYPDFYLPELDLFVEIKGFCSEADFAKFDQFPYSLTVLFSTSEIAAWEPPV